MAFQFVHMESFSRKGDAKDRTVAFVMAEARRDPVASVHVSNPARPVLVYGSTIEEVEAMHDAAADAARTTVKGGGTPRKLRQDHKTLHTVIASHPYTMDEIRADPVKLREAEEWEKRTISWLRSQYGDDLKCVVRHEDESHFHLHAYVVPTDDTEMRALRHHPGVTAKRAAMSAGAADEDKKALSKRADAAYKAALRGWQDSYHETVGIPCGLARLGPQRRSLTRAEWQAEKVQARALKATLDRARAVKARGESMIAATKEDAARIASEAAAAQAEAARQIAIAKAATEAAKAAQDKAVGEQRRAQSMMMRVRQEAARVREATARLQRLPGVIRSVLDGFRASKVASRIRAAVESEMEALRRTAADAADRARAADAGRRDAEARAKNLRASLTETGRDLATARRELAALRPPEPATDISTPAPRRS